jgi:DNA-nicking Smr family endonuclease
VREGIEKPRRSAIRRLSEEEIALWVEVAKSVARRRGANLPALAPRSAPSPAAALIERRAASPVAQTPRKPPAPPPLAPLERRLKRDLARGRGAIDSAIDLHGMNQAEAHQALRGFLVHAQSQGARLVIVVTGKGGRGGAGSPGWIDEPGVLRRLVPHWLRESDMRSIVLGFEEAGRAHGGSGALYVRLRKRERR